MGGALKVCVYACVYVCPFDFNFSLDAVNILAPHSRCANMRVCMFVLLIIYAYFGYMRVWKFFLLNSTCPSLLSIFWHPGCGVFFHGS